MYKALRSYLRLALCAVLLCLSGRTLAQEQSLDSSVSDSAFVGGLQAPTPISGEYVAPDRPTIYNTASPTDAQWARAISDKAYSYRDKHEFVRKRSDNDVPAWIGFMMGILSFFSSPFGKVVLWSALIIIVGSILFRIIRGQAGSLFAPRDRKPDAAEVGKLNEDILLESDWEKQMSEAMQTGDNRAVIRYGYLRLLQLLQDRGYIAYRQDKTNVDYYQELADKPQRQAFRAITRQYEWAWYGNILPSRTAMESYLQTFQQLKQSLVSA